jgi:hypothetical protein
MHTAALPLALMHGGCCMVLKFKYVNRSHDKGLFFAERVVTGTGLIWYFADVFCWRTQMANMPIPSQHVDIAQVSQMPNVSKEQLDSEVCH